MVLVAVVGVAVTMVGWFVTPNITELMKVARDYAADSSGRYKFFRGNKEKLEKLAQDLWGIKHILDQVSASFVDDQARLNDLWQLKEYIHDAEEVLDQFELARKATDGLLDGMKSYKALSDQLVKVLKNLGETRQRASELHQVRQISSSILNRAETGHLPVRDKRSFFGYHHEYNQLYSLLQQKPDGDKKVIAIVGHGGMGKTELARQAFRDAEDRFHLRIWVHAYGKNTELDLLQEMWRSVPGKRSVVGHMNVSCLQNELEKHLASQRCLLVLDDVWNHETANCEMERKHAWQAVESCSGFVEDGSRVVVTTRAKICSATFRADASIILDGIKPDEITRLVNDTASLRTDCTTAGIQERLNKQVPKLKGSPLAAVEIGEELKEQATGDECCNILDNIEEHIGNVLSAHLFTYRHLPPHLQRCFELCSIFPNNWRFEPEKLMRMWIAHGFVQDAKQQGPSMEHVARGYFKSLVDRSLFQEATEPGGGRETTYVIHEQIHWMIRRASAKICSSISTASRSIPATVRHLSVTTDCLDQLKDCKSSVLNNVRTLLILQNGAGDGGGIITTIDKGILKQFKGVRVLDLTQTGLTQLPGTIGKLKYVRYLGLPSTTRTLCEQLTRLLFLQTFSVSGAHGTGRRKENTCQLQRFPLNMNRLTNMRHLDITPDCITNISGIGNMVKLQGSIVFRVRSGSEKEGHRVSELAHMSSLGGTLTIKGLDAVASKEEATAARLASKGSVEVLKLEWGPPDPRQVSQGPTDDAAAAVLECLKPHCHLHDLRITRYPGARPPSWLKAMEKLKCLYLRNCRRLKALPALGELPCLELLDMKELTVVERIDGRFCGSTDSTAFPNLKKIVLDDMPELVAWDDMPKGAFPLLSYICIIDCPKLSSLPSLEWCSRHGLRVKGCPAIKPETLPRTFSIGPSA